MFFPVTVSKNCAFDATLTTAIASAPYIAISGDYLYICSSSANTLAIYDITDPSSPVLKSSTSTGAGTGPKTIVVLSEKAYICYNTSGEFAVWDVSSKTAPSESGKVAVGTSPIGHVVSGNFAYVPLYSYSASANLKKVDISTPSAPSVTGTWVYNVSNGSRCQSCAISGSTLYVPGNYNSASGNNFLAAVAISTMATTGTPATWGSGGGDVTAGGIALGVGFAYVVRGIALVVQAFDLTNPISPVAGNTVAITGTATVECDIVYKRNKLYMGKQTGSALALYKYDVTTASTPIADSTISSNSEGVINTVLADDECLTLAFSTFSGGAKVYLKGNA